MSTQKRFWLALLIAMVFTAATALPFCGTMFNCGCDLLHGSSQCSIHATDRPHCPWCRNKSIAFAMSFIVVVPGMIATIAASSFMTRRLWIVAVVGVLTYLILAAITGYFSARTYDYPTWFGYRI